MHSTVRHDSTHAFILPITTLRPGITRRFSQENKHLGRGLVSPSFHTLPFRPNCYTYHLSLCH